jgi:hypothetical protein
MRNDEVRGDLEKLVALIHEHTKPLKIAGGFFEKTVNAAFRAKYEGSYFNRPSESSPERELTIATDDWLLTGAPLCERIYEHVMSGDVSY